MAIVTTDNRHYSDIANAIRAKNGGSALYLPEDMADAVLEIPSGGTSAEDDIISRTISGNYTNDRVTNISGYAFYGCTSLTSVDFPKVTSIYTQAFRGCTSLTSVDFPKVTGMGGSVFRDCTSLTSVDFPKVTSISGYAFYGSGLNALILRNDTSVVNLTATNAFNSTPITDGTGYIYVPDDMVDDYKQATNWVNFASQIKGLSELEV